ncbi:MAG: hypothetical protein JSV66_10620 [Trueperaceae bacterium]|nr:MAG: hypothetical protein JSV66_10620 [Trueperaceae bacterium]
MIQTPTPHDTVITALDELTNDFLKYSRLLEKFKQASETGSTSERYSDTLADLSVQLVTIRSHVETTNELLEQLIDSLPPE